MNISNILQKIKEKLFSKSVFKIFSSLILKFGAILLGVYVARWLNKNINPEELKNYNLAISYTPIILGLVAFGIPSLIQKYFTNEKNKEKTKQIWTTFLFLRFCSYFIGLFLVICIFAFLDNKNLLLILLIFTIQFILIADSSFRSVCDSLNMSWKFSLTDLANKILIVGLLISLELSNGNLNTIYIFLAINLVANLIAYCVDTFWHFSVTGFGIIDFSFIKRNISSILYLTLPFLFFFGNLDKPVLLYFNVETYPFIGYSNAYKLYEMSLLIPALIVPIIASKIKIEIDEKSIKHHKYLILRKWITRLFGLGICVAFCIYLISPLLISVIDSTNIYTTWTKPVFAIFTIGIATNFVSLLFYNLNIFFHREKVELFTHIFNSTFLFCLYIILIPFFGILGPAIALVFLNFFDATRRTANFIFKGQSWF